MFAAGVLLLAVLLAAGCARKMQAPPQIYQVSEQERDFAGALQALRGGREQQARELLEKVLAAPAVNGVTDEALFRLALLSVRDEGGRGPLRARALLEQLENQYPTSAWVRQSAPLSSFLAGIILQSDSRRDSQRDSQRELRSLRNLNLSLSRDNRELRQTIERLKSLDIELEQKIKR